MLKEFADFLVKLGEDKTIVTKEINGDTYASKELRRIAPHVDRPKTICVNGLDSIAKLVRHELDLAENYPVYIRVSGPRSVEVFSTLDGYMERDYLYEAVCDAPDFKGGWQAQEEAIIKLRSAFIPNEGTEYLLDLLSRICKEDSVGSDDNGVSQTVTARQGISLKHFEPVRSRIPLRPYRTFTEVKQPESEFILRLDEEGRVGLIEADGGAWKMEAKANIAAYFEEALSDAVQSGKVVVML